MWKISMKKYIADVQALPEAWGLIGLPEGGWPETMQAIRRLQECLPPRERRDWGVHDLVDALYEVDSTGHYRAREEVLSAPAPIRLVPLRLVPYHARGAERHARHAGLPARYEIVPAPGTTGSPLGMVMTIDAAEAIAESMVHMPGGTVHREWDVRICV